MEAQSKTDLLAYTPMLHARLFAEDSKYRQHSFQPIKSAVQATTATSHDEGKEPQLYLDGNPAFDRPLIVQFCANDAEVLLEAAKHVSPFCDAVDLNLGCPQGIARKGHYGAFLQEDWNLVYRLINKLHRELDVPVTAKMRILETKEKTLAYAQKILSAGASILTVHGRRREQKSHNTGIADWGMIRYLRENLPPETVIFANGNILQHEDIKRCLDATGADGVMSAEGNLHDPSIFACPPPIGQESREYWRGRDGKGGYRMDAVMRRYLDIIYKYVLNEPAPQRVPLFLLSDPVVEWEETPATELDVDEPPRKKQKEVKRKRETSVNLSPMQAHLFNLLRPLVSQHHHIRDTLARSGGGHISKFEQVLSMVEKAIKEGLIEYEKSNPIDAPAPAATDEFESVEVPREDWESSESAIARCKRPWWVCQPYIRPLPKEAIAKGALQLSKKEKAELAVKALQNGSKGTNKTASANGATVEALVNETVETMNDRLSAG
jgi:tRNA-dihydrouridine synthase 1